MIRIREELIPVFSAVLGNRKLKHIFVTVGLKEPKSMSTPNRSFIAKLSNIVNLDIIY